MSDPGARGSGAGAAGGPLTTVVSDFGGVLTTPLWEAFAIVQEQVGIPPDALGSAMAAVTEREGVNPLHELECGRLGEDRFYTLLADQLGADLGRPIAFHAFPDHYFAALAPNDALIAELGGLRRAGYRLALLTNNVKEWEPRWRAMLPVDELFEVVVDSAFVGLRKPDPAIYELTCTRLGVAPAECVFIDDFPHNCDAATALGMTAVRFETTEQALGELRAHLSARGAPPLGAPTDRVGETGP
jgi:putative hydrolase of the HAD superfamily